jgi:hypothetical protein
MPWTIVIISSRTGCLLNTKWLLLAVASKNNHHLFQFKRLKEKLKYSSSEVSVCTSLYRTAPENKHVQTIQCMFSLVQSQSPIWPKTKWALIKKVNAKIHSMFSLVQSPRAKPLWTSSPIQNTMHIALSHTCETKRMFLSSATRKH